ncbi:MAG: cyclic pyranopterin monophosphate synthase MoaC [Candidatus Eiseniibacteriota bacterium]|jgi:cyclic pyranopterin phosphate synthase
MQSSEHDGVRGGRTGPASTPPAAGASHLDAAGRAHMVDVGDKPVTARQATAMARMRVGAAALGQLTSGRTPKGDALAVARLAGIQAAKRTADWIPLCHPLPLELVEVDVTPDPDAGQVYLRAVARARARTGVEMEALVAVTAAALALYDMLKGTDPAIVIETVRLVEKRGGRRGTFTHPDGPDEEPA